MVSVFIVGRNIFPVFSSGDQWIPLTLTRKPCSITASQLGQIGLSGKLMFIDSLPRSDELKPGTSGVRTLPLPPGPARQTTGVLQQFRVSKVDSNNEPLRQKQKPDPIAGQETARAF
jgi:hypothetical protein